jgi:hypothetical protein
MIASVDTSLYQLQGGINNSNWARVFFSSGTGTDTTVVKLPLYVVSGTKDTIKVYGVDSSFQRGTIVGSTLKLYRYNGDSTSLTLPSTDTTGTGELYIRNLTTQENKRFNVKGGRLDTLYASTSGGGRVVSNSGTIAAEWGAGGGANFDFHGFAGYNANRASSYTTRSFTDKNYVDSSLTLKTTVTSYGKNAGGDSTILLLSNGTRFAARDSIGGGGGNIYTADGTLTSARTLTSGGFPLTFTGTNTASSAIARGLRLNHTLAAAANGDALVGLDIANTYTLGAFSATPYAIRAISSVVGNYQNLIQNTSAGNASTGINLGNDLGIIGGVSTFSSTHGVGSSLQNNLVLATSNPSSSGNITIGTNFDLASGGSGVIKFWTGGYVSSNERMRILSSGNISMGYGSSPTDAGYKLDVFGYARLNANTNAFQGLNIFNSSSGSSAFSAVNFYANVGEAGLGKNSTTRSYKFVGNSDLFFINSVNGNVSILNDFASGKIQFGAGASSTAQMTLQTNGELSLGTTTAVASSILTATSTTQGVLFPRMSTSEKNAIASPVAGLVVYDTTLNKLCVYTTAWETITSL